MLKIVNEPIVEMQFDRLEKLCLILFDGWRERRRVLPLAYLLSAWPIISPSRLTDVLRELQLYHSNMLTPDEDRVITQILGIDVRGMEQVVEHPSAWPAVP
jgi:hypothetical protein